MLKHVGKIASTDSKCVVVMMQIPGREDHALICESDSLPDRLHQVVMGIVESKEGQASKNLSEALSRRYDAETGMDVLNTLHNHNRLRAVPVDQVYMVPAPGRVYPLNKILSDIQIMEGNTTSQPLNPSAYGDPSNPKYNPHLENLNSSSREELEGSARSLLTQAELMMHDAKNLMERAYTMAPTLRPRGEAIKREVLAESTKHVDVQEESPKRRTTKKTTEKADTEVDHEAVMAMYSNMPTDETKPAPAKRGRKPSNATSKTTTRRKKET